MSKHILEQDARTLSVGEAARIGLIRAIIAEPRVLLLDEPVAALDSKAASAVMDIVSQWAGEEQARGVVIVSHVGDNSTLPGVSFVDIGLEEGGSK
ncbi:ATP-binding cassette domain-containing protein [Phosphitispora sp. TUW77]|uniref:ATP-binding cassette domain-containing protein n=1 Tax=Phosphitispora sp. TUW77 TaxID=3152361 RepID=UPI003AB84004